MPEGEPKSEPEGRVIPKAPSRRSKDVDRGVRYSRFPARLGRCLTCYKSQNGAVSYPVFLSASRHVGIEVR